MYRILFVHSITEGHQSHFHILATVKNAAVRLDIQIVAIFTLVEQRTSLSAGRNVPVETVKTVTHSQPQCRAREPAGWDVGLT